MAKTIAQLKKDNAALRELAKERNMVSDLIMADDPGVWLSCVFEAHDAHSFWSVVRREHAAMKERRDD